MNKARVSASRKRTHSIMSNSGFGGLTIHTPEGATIHIPKEQITQKGNVRSVIEKRTHEMTRENIEFLESRGVQVMVGGVSHGCR